MARIQKKPDTSLGSFSKGDADKIKEGLNLGEAVPVTVQNLQVEGEATEWYQVFVPNAFAIVARAWLRGWLAGKASS